MELKNMELLPGIVINNKDPEDLGRVKAIVPRYFTPSMGEENIPWIWPFTSSGSHTFSVPQNQNKIWVFINKEGYQEYWYMQFYEPDESIRDLTYANDNVQIVASNNQGMRNSQIFLSDKEGIVLENDDSKINITQGGEINLLDPNGMGVMINTNHVMAGDFSDEDGMDNLVKAGEMKMVLAKLGAALEDLAGSLDNDPKEMPLYTSCTLAANACKHACGSSSFQTNRFQAN